MAYYTKTGNPVNNSKGVSKTIRDEFILIETAFTNLEAYAITKSTKAGDTYTGTHDFTAATISAGVITAPTQVVADNSTKVATTAFCQALALSSAASLPGQTGNAGKFLGTNGTAASWLSVGVSISTRTSNTIFAVSDSGSFINYTSGTFTQTFTAAATLGSTWYVYLKNSGTGDITIDPNASETIDGLASFIMYPGEARLIQCDGTSFTSIVLNPFYKTFTATGTFTKPPGYNLFSGLVWGGGASGRKSQADVEALGGGGAACTPFTLPVSIFGTTETVTIGAGGAAVSTANTAGNPGGNSSIGSLVYSYSNTTYNLGGSCFKQDHTVAGVGEAVYAGGQVAYIVYGGLSALNVSGSTYAVVYGSTSGGYVQAGGAVEVAATSKYGGTGGIGSSDSNGVAGSIPGGGGGGTQTGASSGAGARGEARIWGVC